MLDRRCLSPVGYLGAGVVGGFENRLCAWRGLPWPWPPREHSRSRSLVLSINVPPRGGAVW